MGFIEYLFALLAIILGLGLTDLAKSFRELVRPGRTVHWHWLPSTWTAVTLLVVINIWWNSIGMLQEAPSSFFLLYVVCFLLLYLLCAFTLPDPDWEQSETNHTDAAGNSLMSTSDALDLKAFYFSRDHRRWYFGLLIALLFVSELGLQAIAVAEGPGLNLSSAAVKGGAIMLLAPLTMTSKWWVHAAVSIVSLIEVTWATINTII